MIINFQSIIFMEDVSTKDLQFLNKESFLGISGKNKSHSELYQESLDFVESSFKNKKGTFIFYNVIIQTVYDLKTTQKFKIASNDYVSKGRKELLVVHCLDDLEINFKLIPINYSVDLVSFIDSNIYFDNKKYHIEIPFMFQDGYIKLFDYKSQ